MKTSLQLKMGQQLKMTPQLQQAIRMLQLSSLELQQEIFDAIESNPMLELEDEDQDFSPITNDNNTISEQPAQSENSNTDNENLAEIDAEHWDENIPQEMSVDTEWDDVFSHDSTSVLRQEQDDSDSLETDHGRGESLQDHLRWQLNVAHISARDKTIALAIIDSIEPSGMLGCPIAEIHAGLCSSWGDDAPEADEVQVMLHLIQQFEPAGVGAQNLRECLLIQLKQLPPNTPWLADARRVVADYLELLGSRDYRQLMRRAGLGEHTMKKVLALIQTLNPHPGESFDQEESRYVIPDVLVTRKHGRWVVELNNDTIPRIRINASYAALARHSRTDADGQFMRERLQEARWFLKSIESRNETLLKVASSIVKFQKDFLEHGDKQMKPLVLQQVADEVGMHESTISRVTTQKYLHTPRGVFQLKYFFSSQVGNEDEGGEHSATAIRACIRELVNAESPRKPLSDNKLASLLAAQGMQVARRTIAKYREALRIPPSHDRKQLG